MGYKQLITPKINIGATAGYCLGYVDNAIGATTGRSYSAQIAYNNAKAKGWVTANQNYPRNVWFVMFWSIDNGAYAGLGHVALAFVDNAGNLQIHDSEVHRGARRPYGSLGELAGWFGSVGTRMTFLGWSIGCDGVKLIEPVATPTPSGGKLKSATVNVPTLNVRDIPSVKGAVVATYSKGQRINDLKYHSIADGYVWYAYTSASGKTRYVSAGKNTGAVAKDDYLVF